MDKRIVKLLLAIAAELTVIRGLIAAQKAADSNETKTVVYMTNEAVDRLIKELKEKLED